MKKIFLLLLLLVSGFSFAQQAENISIEWIDNSGLTSESTTIKIPLFNAKNFFFDYNKSALIFNHKFPVAGFADESSLKITNIVYETVSQSKLGELDINSIPNSIQASLRNMNNPENQMAVISLSPIIKTGNGFQRIKSFSYNYSLGTSQRKSNNFRTNAISNSVLSSGEWFRFYIEKSGVYKISRSFLESLGMNPSVSDPRNIKIFGNGGRMIPLLNGTPYPFDLAENAITLIGENDGSFDRDDYILFYAEGVDNWNADSETHNNLYSDRSYYYVTSQGGQGKRISPMPAINQNPTLNVSTFDDYQYYEIDKNNIVRLGRKWFGEPFNIKDQQTFEFKFPNIVTGSQTQIEVFAASNAVADTKMDVAVNEQTIGSFNFVALRTNGPLADTTTFSGAFNANENVKIKLTYVNNGVPSANAYLDYIILKAKRNLTGYGKQFRFQYDAAATATGVAQYQFSNSSGINSVWDITDIYNVSKTDNTANASFSFKAFLGEVRKYIAIDPSNYLSPAKESQSRVANQNIKGTIFKNRQGVFQDVDYIIVTPASLNSQAERLADFHRNSSQLNVKVINLENIYQEFSSGKQDIGAIRNLAKYVYENASTPAKRLKYLNLFGDASYDFKNRIPNNTNIVPAFQSLESYTLGGSYVTDDFYAMFDDTEGVMNANASRDDMEIAVGRMLVSNSTQAAEMVNKVIDYHSKESYGKWRNNFVLISDDLGDSLERILQEGLDSLGDEISAQKPFINVKKIHSDSYVQESSAGGQRYPKVREDFIEAFEQGGLVFNYYGHGSEDGLAHERIFEKSDAQKLNNKNKYPLFITITCEFTRFDNPYRPTGGEEMYWNPNGGAISLVTTTRQIGIYEGKTLNDAFAKNLFGYGTNEYTSVAEALRISKKEHSGTAYMVSYIGDPALKLAIPKPTIVLTKINDEPAATSPFVFNALRPVKITGEVRNLEGNTIISNYNGDISVNIFDKNVKKKTLGNDGITDGSGALIIMDFELLGETIFRGNASVKNGQFELSFVVPRDITIPVGNGRISFYAKRTQGLEDQTGFNTEIKVGGINESAVADNIGPRAKLYMNDETFISGGITNESPFFLAFLEDENGINTASGIGHDIVAILDGNEDNPYILNDYYETELDDYTKGKVRFPLRNLAVGLHTITFKAWDVYNNPITSEIQFIVVGDENVTLTHVLNYPNPFVSYTQFWFTHNRPYEPLEVQVQILTITGKIVKTINQIVNTEGFLSREISWDGKDDFGDKIGKGVYVYKLTVKSTFTNKKTEKFEKLVIL